MTILQLKNIQEHHTYPQNELMEEKLKLSLLKD